MRTRATLPLGIDVGTMRTRVALLERDLSGTPRLIAVASRPTGPEPADAIAAARAELGTRERRCVLSLGAPDALLRTAALPRMTRRERTRAARCAAASLAPFPMESASVRVVVLSRTQCVLGIAQRDVLEGRVHIARRARLRLLAIDDIAFALLRAFPDDDAVVDVGMATTTLIVAGEPLPSVQAFAAGGRDFTAAIAAALDIDAELAERRKRDIGHGGAGEHARDAFVAALAAAVRTGPAEARQGVRSIVLTGNGARLQGLAAALERAVAIPVRLASQPAGPDGSLAYGLALWAAAR